VRFAALPGAHHSYWGAYRPPAQPPASRSAVTRRALSSHCSMIPTIGSHHHAVHSTRPAARPAGYLAAASTVRARCPSLPEQPLCRAVHVVCLSAPSSRCSSATPAAACPAAARPGRAWTETHRHTLRGPCHRDRLPGHITCIPSSLCVCTRARPGSDSTRSSG